MYMTLKSAATKARPKEIGKKGAPKTKEVKNPKTQFNVANTTIEVDSDSNSE